MKHNTIFFIFLLILILILFSFLYLIGVTNLFFPNNQLLNNFSWLKFPNQTISFLYLIFLSIFFIVVLSIVVGIIISFNQEKTNLTNSSIDEFSIKTKEDDGIDTSYNNLNKTLQTHIDAFDKFATNIDQDIDRISSLENEKNYQDQLDNLFQEFSTMTTDIVTSSTVAELFEKILIWGTKLSKSKRGSLMVVDDNKELYIYRVIGWNDEDKNNINEIKIPIGSGIAGKVASENKRIFVTNIENYDDHEFKFKEQYETKSFISLPISGLKKVVAVLNLTDSTRGYYSMNDLESLNTIINIGCKIFELIQRRKKSR